MQSTAHQGSYFAHRITLEGLGEDALAQSLSTTRVDLNPHQVDVALFALRLPSRAQSMYVGSGERDPAWLPSPMSSDWMPRQSPRRAAIIGGVAMEETMAFQFLWHCLLALFAIRNDLFFSRKTVVRASLAVGLYIAAPHTFCAYGFDPTDDLNSQLSNSPKSLAPTPEYAQGAQFFDIKATEITYAPTFKKYLYSFALPRPALGIVGFGGYVSITSAMSRFSEALISVHQSPSGHCPSNGALYDTYDQIGHDFPDSQAFGQFILKLPAAGTAQVPTQFALPAAIPVRGCIFVILDGGIEGAGGVFTMTSGMSLAYTAGQPPSSAAILSLGDEFCLGQSSGCQLASTNTSEHTAFAKVVKITQSSTLKALYGDISDSALGPAGYAPPPTGSWNTWNDFYVYKGCTGIPEGITGPADYYALIPADAVHLLNVTQQGTDDAVVQQMVYKSLSVPLNTGDCLVHLFKGNPNGGMSAEAQVLALVQPNTAPIGNLDSVTSSGLVSGWGLDPDTPTTPINVHFYLDSPSGQSAFIGLTSANMSRPDVNQVTGYPGDHGFSFQLPSSVSNCNHTIYVYGIDSAGGPNPLLSGAPMTVTISTSGGVGGGSPR